MCQHILTHFKTLLHYALIHGTLTASLNSWLHTLWSLLLLLKALGTISSFSRHVMVRAELCDSVAHAENVLDGHIDYSE